jgi:hypothetical protein
MRTHGPMHPAFVRVTWRGNGRFARHFNPGGRVENIAQSRSGRAGEDDYKVVSALSDHSSRRFTNTHQASTATTSSTFYFEGDFCGYTVVPNLVVRHVCLEIRDID